MQNTPLCTSVRGNSVTPIQGNNVTIIMVQCAPL